MFISRCLFPSFVYFPLFISLICLFPSVYFPLLIKKKNALWVHLWQKISYAPWEINAVLIPQGKLAFFWPARGPKAEDMVHNILLCFFVLMRFYGVLGIFIKFKSVLMTYDHDSWLWLMTVTYDRDSWVMVVSHRISVIND